MGSASSSWGCGGRGVVQGTFSARPRRGRHWGMRNALVSQDVRLHQCLLYRRPDWSQCPPPRLFGERDGDVLLFLFFMCALPPLRPCHTVGARLSSLSSLCGLLPELRIVFIFHLSLVLDLTPFFSTMFALSPFCQCHLVLVSVVLGSLP